MHFRVGMYMWVHAYMCARKGQKSMLGTSSIFVETVSLTEPAVHQLNKMG